ncbi:hypothetical protein AAVH_20413 [Aphelenchoides avenae]|nr:hypothetical protein AAVH_20413 [Aphelenchus avenae]
MPITQDSIASVNDYELKKAISQAVSGAQQVTKAKRIYYESAAKEVMRAEKTFPDAISEHDLDGPKLFACVSEAFKLLGYRSDGTPCEENSTMPSRKSGGSNGVGLARRGPSQGSSRSVAKQDDDIEVLENAPPTSSKPRRVLRQIPDHWSDYPWLVDQVVQVVVSRRSILDAEKKQCLENAVKATFNGKTSKQAAEDNRASEVTVKKYFGYCREQLFNYLGDTEPPLTLQRLLKNKGQHVTLADIDEALEPEGGSTMKIKPEPVDEGYNPPPAAGPSARRSRGIKREVFNDEYDADGSSASKSRTSISVSMFSVARRISVKEESMGSGHTNGHAQGGGGRDNGVVRDNLGLLHRLYNGQKIIVIGSLDDFRARIADVITLAFSGPNADNLIDAVVYTFEQGPLSSAASQFGISNSLLIDALAHCDDFVAFDLCRIFH